MSQLAREFPEEYAEIARLPPAQQNAAERALAARAFARLTTPEETAELQSGARVVRRCRDCGNEYTVPVEHAKSGSKWWSLCGSCIQYEL